MTTESFPKADIRTLLRRPVRGRGWLAAAMLFGVCFILGLGYHLLIWRAQSAASTGLQVVYVLVIGIGYTALWFAISGFMKRAKTSPARTLWTILAVGLIVMLLGAVVSRIGRPELPDSIPFEARLGFDINTGAPLVLATVVKMNLISLGQILFSFVLLIRLRDLVLVKRSRSSQRNWAIMIGMMIVVAGMTVMKAADSELSEWQKIAMIIAVVFMVVNAFRLSWIVFLPFKEKMATIGLCFTLILTLIFGLGILSDGPSRLIVPGAYNYLEHYSYALAVFTSQAAIFGILYCSTAFLSLLFHLPTSGEYEQRAGERATMSSLAHLVGQVFDVESLYATIAAAPVEAGSADSSWLAILDPSSGSLTPTIAATHGADAATIARCVDLGAILSELDRTGEALVMDEAPGDHRIDARPGEGFDSMLVVPLIARNDTLGALFAAKEVIHGFERDDVETVGIFAAQAAVALDNARLFEQKVEKERLSRELSIAREVQRRLLPQHVPQAAGLSMAASSVSA
ncbi:MAG: GAF domain-containing protein, partial [Rhodothermales bacterium]|nr:GAF domain-containing protein [Rhodothermales bacterium]